MPTLDQNFTVDGLGTPTVTLTRRGIGGNLNGYVALRLGALSPSIMCRVIIDNFFDNTWNTIAVGYVNYSTTPINITIRGFFNDLRVSIMRFGDTQNIPSSSIVLLYRLNGDENMPEDAYVLPGFYGGINLESQQQLYGAHIVDSGILERPRKTILRATTGNMYVYGAADNGQEFSAIQSAPIVIMPRMTAGVKASDTIIVTVCLSCTPAAPVGQPNVVDGFAIDAYGFNVTHTNGYSPWQIGRARKMYRAIWDCTGPYTSSSAAVSFDFYGTTISYNSDNTFPTGFLDPGVEAKRKFMATMPQPLYYGFNGAQAIMTEVSSRLIVGSTSTATLSVSGYTQSSPTKSIIGSSTEPSRLSAYATVLGNIGGNPPKDTIPNRAIYKVQMVIKGSNMSMFVEAGQSGMVYVGSAYGEFDALSVPAITLFGASDTAVPFTIRDFNVGIVEPQDITVGVGSLGGIGRNGFITSVTATDISGETPKNVVSIFGSPAIVYPTTLRDVTVTGKHIPGKIDVVSLESTQYATQTTLYDSATNAPTIVQTTATASKSRSITTLPFTLSPYCLYGVAVDNVAIGTYTCTYDFGA